MERVYKKAVDCCGCTLCADVCPTGAVSMDEKGGFLYPQIASALCVDCGKCQAVCVIQHPFETALPQAAYGARLHHTQMRLKSSSGGAFTALSDAFLENGDAVCGVKFDKKMRARYMVTTSKTERNHMRGSKYVQADMQGVFAQLQKRLEQEKSVLFFGTPCAVAAVKRRFPDAAGLYTVDLICHGVPSPAVWQAYVSYLEGAFDAKLTDYRFRDKANGWYTYHAVATFADGKTITDTPQTDSYLELFTYDVCLRPSCTACPYAQTERVGDITIGDFWGVENCLPQLDDGKGVSAVLINTEKGERLCEFLRKRMELLPCALSDITAGQQPLRFPSKRSVKADAFVRDFSRLSFDRVLRKYTRLGFSRRFKDAVKKILHKT